jgi:hypothetical protein
LRSRDEEDVFVFVLSSLNRSKTLPTRLKSANDRGFSLASANARGRVCGHPTRSFMLRRRSDQGGSSPRGLARPWFFPIAAAQHENGAHSPTPWAAKRSASIRSALGRSSIRAVGANAGTIGLARHHLFLDWGADGFSRPVSPRPETQKKAASQAAF